MRKFIMTSSEETANKLLSMGYTLITNENNKWIFLNNNPSMNYAELKEVVLTDKMFV